MKIKTFGWQGYTGQIQRIEQGFKILGHEIVNDINQAEVAYFNDKNFNDLSILEKFKGIKIFNILDAINTTEEERKIWMEFLRQADHITCISQTVKKDVKKLMGLEAEVIYNPIKDVCQIKNSQRIINEDFLYVGRTYDNNKRFYLLKELFNSYLKDKDLAICGAENPLFGKYYGIVPDDILNKIYNSIEIVFLPSKEEGIGLSMIEALVCGKMPICCKDNETAKEFLPSQFLSEATPESIFDKTCDFFENKSNFLNNIKELQKIYQTKFDKVAIAKNIINLCK